jgi:hypothetical protein
MYPQEKIIYLKIEVLLIYTRFLSHTPRIINDKSFRRHHFVILTMAAVVQAAILISFTGKNSYGRSTMTDPFYHFGISLFKIYKLFIFRKSQNVH